MKTLTPHQKIMRAARRGTGLWLNAEEVGHSPTFNQLPEPSEVTDTQRLARCLLELRAHAWTNDDGETIRIIDAAMKEAPPR